MGFQLPTSTGELAGFLNHQQYLQNIYSICLAFCSVCFCSCFFWPGVDFWQKKTCPYGSRYLLQEDTLPPKLYPKSLPSSYLDPSGVIHTWMISIYPYLDLPFVCKICAFSQKKTYQFGQIFYISRRCR